MTVSRLATDLTTASVCWWKGSARLLACCTSIWPCKRYYHMVANVCELQAPTHAWLFGSGPNASQHSARSTQGSVGSYTAYLHAPAPSEGAGAVLLLDDWRRRCCSGRSSPETAQWPSEAQRITFIGHGNSRSVLEGPVGAGVTRSGVHGPPALFVKNSESVRMAVSEAVLTVFDDIAPTKKSLVFVTN